MKQELPIAATLLAFGCLLWLWQSREASQASAANSQAEIANETPAPSTPARERQFATDMGQASSAELLKQISGTLQNGPPTFGDLKITNHLFEKTQAIKGRFWNQGQGSGKSRLELILDSKNPKKLTQVCDGRFLYRLTEHRDQRQLKFHDLRRLNNEDAGIVQATLPAAWVGSGSLGSLFSNLTDAFNFGAMKSSPNNQRLVEMVGTWNPTHLSKLMANRVDHREILPSPDWSKLPPQIPHGVRLRFENQDSSGWQPVEILFFKFDGETKTPAPTMSIQFGQIHHQSISAEFFRLDFDETGAIDETDLYNEHIDLMTGKHRVAEETGDAMR